ncbi:MAG: glycosyltransferase family 9 protein [Alphaproteobacteria bacterium]|nr:glycosyltransferase family 9 protein [Alphaproteobacteria bacterium]
MTRKLEGRTLVIQPYPGIGDMLWHLPQLRAIASLCEDSRVSVLTKSRTLAKQWLQHDPIIDEIYYAEKDEIMKSARLLKEQDFTNSVILHGSFTFGSIPFLASIPNRYGYGFGLQRFWLNRPPFLEASLKALHAIDLAERFTKRFIKEEGTWSRDLFVSDASRERARNEFKDISSPRVCFGIGASDAFKKWPLDAFAELAKQLKDQAPHLAFFVLGAPHEACEVRSLEEKCRIHGVEVVPVTHLPIDDVFALISESSLFVGNDSGLMNASACLGVPTVGLFGVTKPLDYLSNLAPMMPLGEDHSQNSTMTRILPKHVLNLILENPIFEKFHSSLQKSGMQ